jgi:hypothetical protein
MICTVPTIPHHILATEGANDNENKVITPRSYMTNVRPKTTTKNNEDTTHKKQIILHQIVLEALLIQRPCTQLVDKVMVRVVVPVALDLGVIE